jgi:hypothetical protein
MKAELMLVAELWQNLLAAGELAQQCVTLAFRAAGSSTQWLAGGFNAGCCTGWSITLD